MYRSLQKMSTQPPFKKLSYSRRCVILTSSGHIKAVNFTVDVIFSACCSRMSFATASAHLGSCRFFDSFMDDEMLNIVMEYAPHGTLKTSLQQANPICTAKQRKSISTARVSCCLLQLVLLQLARL
jgi:hypothetical protein